MNYNHIFEHADKVKQWNFKKQNKATECPVSIVYGFLVVAVLYFLLGTLAWLTGWNTASWKAEASELPQYEEIVAEVTAYSEIDSCHYEGCITASGVPAYIGGIACPRDIELGTKVKIKGVNYTCEDRTNLNLNGRYDLFLGYGKEAHQRAKEFGVQLLSVKVIK